LRTVFDAAKKQEKIKELEKETRLPDFWQDREKAVKITQDLSKLKEELSIWEELKKELEDLRILNNETEEEDTALIRELEEKIQLLENKVSKEQEKVFLSGKYDKNSAILSIYSGAGGQDAQDWVTMLLRMYEKYCQSKGFKTKILHQSFGEGGGPEGRIGTKQVVLEVEGKFAYGFLRKEAGVHRLVRISPFSTKKLRHTSFALVEILPKIEKDLEKEIEIKLDDLKIETFRASGPGGQYVNRRETAVRIWHLPTGLSTACQSERSQSQNKEKALEQLRARLFKLKEEEKEKELAKIKGKPVSIGWGSQIRSYVLHPYTLVKDLRTGVEVSNVDSVLDGNLDRFITAEIKQKND
jgi:peptide chain release factor 2